MKDKLRVAMVDDEPLAIETNHIIIKEHCPGVEVIWWAAGIDSALEQIKANPPEVLLLDVELSNGTGFDLLNRLDRIDFQVVFITAYDKYAIRAFEFSAIDYILKPYPIESLQAAFDKAISQREVKWHRQQLEAMLENLEEPKKLVIATQSGMEIVPLDELIYLEADSNYTNLICKNDRTILSSKTLKHYDEQLEGPMFGRIHQSFLVNKKFIKELRPKEHSVLLINGKSLPVSTRKLKGVMEWLNQS